jgi:hypothetical protein
VVAGERLLDRCPGSARTFDLPSSPKAVAIIGIVLTFIKLDEKTTCMTYDSEDGDTG